ncbi:MAG: hypothetical protein GC158_05345 [Cyanobacteria bacterium RI_101]|nr:hypothetical protein [Cyanobacteria bacterium RI_101]
MSINLRQKLHQKVDQFSESQLEILAKMADLVEQNSAQAYEDWSNNDWRSLALQFLWEDEESEISWSRVNMR